MDINLSAPIWAIEHVAAALLLEVDTAREYTSSPTFPAPKAGFARHVWLREAPPWMRSRASVSSSAVNLLSKEPDGPVTKCIASSTLDCGLLGD